MKSFYFETSFASRNHLVQLICCVIFSSYCYNSVVMNKDVLFTFQEGSKNSYVNHGLFCFHWVINLKSLYIAQASLEVRNPHLLSLCCHTWPLNIFYFYLIELEVCLWLLYNSSLLWPASHFPRGLFGLPNPNPHRARAIHLPSLGRQEKIQKLPQQAHLHQHQYRLLYCLTWGRSSSFWKLILGLGR